MNTSIVSDLKTASTCIECAEQRAARLSYLGVKIVIELCVGPSFHLLKNIYTKYGIEVHGNDIDIRWKRFYEKGHWLIGDALNIDISEYDHVVFAPPLSSGCTGKRSDSLRIDQVVPSYADFISKFTGKSATLVLPGRSQSTSRDREQFYKLLNMCSAEGFGTISSPLVAGKRKIVKYIDLDVCKKCDKTVECEHGAS